MALHDPFDADTKLDSCTCGQHASQTQHDIATAAGAGPAAVSRSADTRVNQRVLAGDMRGA